ncbi:MAG: hypothetical protein KGR26_06420 [Cyanobacteria bacterium REEB65]|nr:hypothetical protein [Cyanobacteria bacterium REEB65]
MNVNAVGQGHAGAVAQPRPVRSITSADPDRDGDNEATEGAAAKAQEAGKGQNVNTLA